MRNKITAPTIAAMKSVSPITAITAYDFPTARVANEANVDIILVGDSLAMVVLGHDDTLGLTTEQMCHHVSAVANAKPSSLIVADMPWMSYHVSVEQTIQNAASLIRAGAEAVKLEGGQNRLPMIKAIVDAEIPVMGHVGLTPQSVHAMGGFKVQAKSTSESKKLYSDAKALESAGCFSIVVEGVPAEVGRQITELLNIATIGIGAGSNTDGQILVFHDLVGLENRFKPKFVRRYGNSFDNQVKAVSEYINDVKSGSFPSEEESY